MLTPLKTLRKDILALFIGSFLLLILAQWVSFWGTLQIDEARQVAKRAADIDLKLETLLSHVKDIETATRGYIITSDPSFLIPYYSGIPNAREDFQALKYMVVDKTQKTYLKQLNTLLEKRIALSSRIVELQRNSGRYMAAQSVREGKGKAVMDQLRHQIDKMLQRESVIYNESRQKVAEAIEFTRMFNVVSLIIALMIQLSVFYFLLKEMTQRQQAEGRVQDLNKQLVHKLELLDESNTSLVAVNKELETFAYSVSHDLRSPLRGIDGFSLALIEDYADKIDDVGKSYLERVRSESQRMGQLIDGILSLSRLTRGEVNRSPVNLSQIALDFVAQLKQEEPNRQVHIHIEPNVIVESDPRLMLAVMQNLVGNAWKFTSKKPVAEIEFGVLEKDDKRFYFVKDNGAGFDMAYANKLFGPFQRLHGMTEYEGTGIGLATVQRIINRHGGSIWAEAEPYKGATFYFSLN